MKPLIGADLGPQVPLGERYLQTDQRGIVLDGWATDQLCDL